MPSRVLSEAEYNAIRDRVLASAPAGMSETDFHRYIGPAMAQAIGEAENLPPKPAGSALGRVVSNVADVFNPVAIAEGLYDAVRHPLNTAHGIVDAARQQFQQADAAVQGRPHRQVSLPTGDIASPEGQAQMQEAVRSLGPPARVATQGVAMYGHGVAGALPLIGPAAAQAGEQIASGDVAGGLSRGAALAFAPAVTEGGLRLAKAGMRRGALRLMQSALKPTDALVNARKAAGFGDKAAIAQAVLDENRIISRGSLRKAQAALNDTDAAVNAQLKAGAGRGVMIDPYQVSDAIGATAQPGGAFARQINAAPDVAAAREVQSHFVTNPEVGPPAGAQGPLQGLPADVAHDFARNTGRNLRGKFGRLGSAAVEAEKAGRENIMGQLRAGVPEIAPLLQQEARQITARDALAGALRRAGNHNPLGLETMVGAVKSPVAAGVGFLDRSPTFLSILANALDRRGPVNVGPAAVRAAILARLNAAQQPQ